MTVTSLSRRTTVTGLGAAIAAAPLAGRAASPSYDYIVVGAGSAGSVLAARLTEKPGVRVLLLEAGGPADDPRIDDPLRWFFLLGTDLVWPDMTIPQAAMGGKQLFAAHGKVIGGSSTINAMIHHRPTPTDIDDWGLDRWRWADLAPMFARSETYLDGPAPGRGASGPILVKRLPDPPPFADTVLAAADRLGLGVSDDINGADKLAVALNQLAYDGTNRFHTGRAYINPAEGRPGLAVKTGAAATGLVFDGARCVGVDYVAQGERRRAEGARVILCAGALRTPQLLMLSGIGPANHLREVGVDVRVDSPGIGANLHDHILISGNNFSTPAPVKGSAYHGSVVVAYGTSDGARRDILLNVSTSPNVMEPLESPQHGYKSSFSFMKPKSRGRLLLAGLDSAAAPVIDHKAFRDPRDVDGALAALAYSRRLLSARELDGFKAVEANADRLADAEGRRQFLNDGATSFGHHCGTCRMGADDDAPTDEALNVRGVDGLSVMDASVFPDIPSCPTNALVVAMAELYAERLQQDA